MLVRSTAETTPLYIKSQMLSGVPWDSFHKILYFNKPLSSSSFADEEKQPPRSINMPVLMGEDHSVMCQGRYFVDKDQYAHWLQQTSLQSCIAALCMR